MNIKTMSYDELSKHVTEAITELKLKAYDEGYKQGKFDQLMETAFERVGEVLSKETPQEKRDRIVERAKADIDSLKGRRRGARYGSIDDLYHISDGSHSGSIALRAKFVINKHKRTVVVILYGAFSNKVRARGIAKCAPNDCFNVHIGKAIALRRALGIEVPDEYLNAPQPTEVRNGDLIKSEWAGHIYEIGKEINEVEWRQNDHIPKIIDDSREGIE